MLLDGSILKSTQIEGIIMIPKKESFEKGLVSVVMSNYNTPVRLLKEAIDSVLEQTYTDFEFIIIDDGSTDDSKELIQSYTDPRIKLICNEANMGLPRSLNKGFEICRGEYIARMDSDDICLPDRFAEQVAYLNDNPEVIVCGTLIEYINDFGETTFKSGDVNMIPDMDCYRICLLFANSPTIFHPTAMFNRKLLRRYHIHYHEEYRYAQDYRIWLSCSKYAKCANVQKHLVKYRNHSEAISTLKRNEQRDYALRVIQEQLNALHLDLTPDIIPVHYNCLNRGSGIGFSVTLKEWMKKIIKSNKKYNIYHQKKLERILLTRLAYLCYLEYKNYGFITRCYYLKELPLKSKIALLRFLFLGDNRIVYNSFEGTISRKP